MSDLRERIVFRWKLDGGELVDAAIAIALEEAARMARSHEKDADDVLHDVWIAGYDAACFAIEHAIRAMIKASAETPSRKDE